MPGVFISTKACYLISYRDPKDGAIVDLKAQTIGDSSLGISFIAISDLIFETNTVLVNPDEESKKKRFENISTFHLSIYSVISIAEMGESTSNLQFKNDKSNLLVMKPESQGAPPTFN